MKVAFLTVLPALGFMVEKRFEGVGDGGSPFGVAQFVNDHRSGEWLFEKRLRDADMAVNTNEIDHADAAPRRRRDGEAPIFAARRK